MGRAYVTGDVTHRSDIVMLVLVGAHVCRWTQAVVWQAVASTGEYRHVMWLNVAEAIANLALSLVLVRTLGLLGVALGTMIPMAVSYLWLMPAHVLKRFRRTDSGTILPRPCVNRSWWACWFWRSPARWSSRGIRRAGR